MYVFVNGVGDSALTHLGKLWLIGCGSRLLQCGSSRQQLAALPAEPSHLPRGLILFMSSQWLFWAAFQSCSPPRPSGMCPPYHTGLGVHREQAADTRSWKVRLKSLGILCNRPPLVSRQGCCTQWCWEVQGSVTESARRAECGARRTGCASPSVQCAK